MDEAANYLRAKEIFQTALDQPSVSRLAFVSTVCRGDRLLQQAVESLLQADTGDDATFEDLLRQEISQRAADCLAASQGLVNADDLLGQVLKGRYYIKQLWRQGGMGWVYLGEDRYAPANAPATVVVKVLQPTGQISLWPWAASHFQQEAQALRRLTHPGIVQLWDDGVTDQGITFLVMEFIEGKPLIEELTPGKEITGGIKRAAQLMRQLGEAIAAAHEKGIYHRDLSPHNVLLQHLNTSWEAVKVIDFGIATVKHRYDEKTKTTVSVSGKPAYMAPEQLDGQPCKETDIYALGVIAYQILTGCTPFCPNPQKGEEFIQLKGFFEQLRRQEIVIANPHEHNPVVPQAAGEIVLRALAYEPTQRYRNAAQFGDALATALLQPCQPPANTNFTFSQKRHAGLWTAGLWTLGVVISALIMTIGRPWQLIPALNTGSISFMVSLPLTPVTSVSPPTVEVNSSLNSTPLKFSYYVNLETPADKKLATAKLRLLTGRELVFKRGDLIRLYLTSVTPGYLYLINEAPISRNGQPEFTMLFPNQVEPHYCNPQQQHLIPNATSAGLEFQDFGGEEKLWLVYARQPIPLLERLRSLLNPEDQGEVRRKTDISQLQNLLQHPRTLPKADPNADLDHLRMEVQGQGDYLLVPIELANQPYAD
jgi:serine/threonine protein kinase